MFEHIENLELISASQGVIKNPSTVENRKLHALIFRTSGSVCYSFGGFSLSVKAGELVYLPKGSSYKYKLLEEPCGYVSIGFDGEIQGAVPSVFSLDSFTDAGYICSHYVNLWKLGGAAEKYKCNSLFYDILSHLSQSAIYSDSRKADLLTPAMEYLKLHIFDTDLKVQSLHTLCGISDTYFRHIFMSKYGDTPQKYITNKRLAYAKSILDGERTESIADIALSVGYSDPLYFSRAFKRKYGVSPSVI